VLLTMLGALAAETYIMGVRGARRHHVNYQKHGSFMMRVHCVPCWKLPSSAGIRSRGLNEGDSWKMDSACALHAALPPEFEKRALA